MIESPHPIIDTLEHTQDPFRSRDFSVSHITELKNADADYEYALRFLYSYNGSTATFNSYRREVERLLQWCWQVEHKSLVEIKRNDIEGFIEFAMAPPASWVGFKQVARFKNKQGLRVANPDWRPYVIASKKADDRDSSSYLNDAPQYKSSQKSVQATFAILSSFFNYLMQEEYLESNPVALIRQKSKFIQRNQYQEQVRRISNLQWDTVIDTAERMAEEDAVHERTLFIMNCLYAMYLRVSELVADERSTPCMGDFRVDSDRNWWLHVTGKGNKNRMITVSDAMLKALKRYRGTLSLPPLPSPGENTPLISRLDGRGSVTSTRQIRFVVQACFDQAYQSMVEQGLADEANELRSATVHWLRHTGISEDVKVRPKEHVKEDAGHSSMATTDKYIDSELRERHASAKYKKIKPEE